MAKAKEVLGKDLMLFVGGKAIALATSCKLSLSSEAINTTTKDSGMWDESIISKLSWNVNSDNTFSADENINGYDTLFEKWVGAEPIQIHFGIPANKSQDEVPDEGWTLPVMGYSGNALITSLEATGASGDKAAFSVTLTGTGKLEKMSK